MDTLDAILRDTGLAARLGPALATYLDSLDRATAPAARRRAWAHLADAHWAQHEALAAVELPAEHAAALHDRMVSARRTFAALAHAEASPGLSLPTRLPRRERARRSRRYAVGAMHLDAALRDALAA